MEYKEYKLKEIMYNFRYGTMPKKEKIKSFAEGKYPIYTGYLISGYYNQCNIENETLIVVARGVGGTGDVKLTPKKCFLTNLSIAMFNDEKIASNKYLYYYFKIHNLRYLDSGSAQSQITINDLKNVKVPVPKRDIQDKIVKILSKLDKKIELNNQINDNLLEISQTIYDNYIKENSNIKYSKIMDLNPRLETGKRPSGGVNEINSGIPSIGAESIKGLGFFDYSKTKYISEEYFTKMKKGIVKGYEVLIYKDGGRPGYFTPNFSMFGEGFPYNKCALNEHVFLLDFNDIKFNVFAYYYFNSIETRNKLHVLGSKSAAIPGINQQDILNLEIPSVENKSINEIIDILMLNTKKILKNSYQNYSLAKLRDTLLLKLMNGEIDLDKIEI